MNNTVLGLNIQVCGLTGSIPTAIGDLSNMNIVYLDQNNIAGTLPSQFGLLKKLQSLYLFQNQLSGSIPVELSSLTVSFKKLRLILSF